MTRPVAIIVGALAAMLVLVAPVAAQDEAPTEPAETTTTIELSAPTITSTLAPTTTSTLPTEPVPTTAAAEVLGAQETNDGQLAATGLDAGVLSALGVALVVGGGVALRRAKLVADPADQYS